jgi:small subunit ribosomal protein S6
MLKQKKQKKALYEGMYILSATLSDEARQRALEKITSGITEREGEVHKVHDQGRRKLAYEIDGRREGYYYLFYFTAPTPVISELWREYHLNEDLIRFSTLRTESVLDKIEFKPLLEM